MNSKIPKPRKGAWFVKVRSSYLPANWKGWLTYIPYIALIIVGLGNIVWPILDCIKFGCSARMSTTMLMSGFIISLPYFVSLVVVMYWIARRKS
jgi:hypothetical protein